MGKNFIASLLIKLMPKLYGVGLGPGSPDLVTVRALNILSSVEVLFAPRSGRGKEIALQIAREALGEEFKVVSLYFPMTRDEEKLEEAWDRAAEKVVDTLGEEGEGAFVTLGDPLFYSTFCYLMNRVKGKVAVEVVPGVTSLSACSSSARFPLAESGDRLAVIPAAYGLEKLEQVAEDFHTVVLMKVSRSYGKIVDRIEELGLEERATLVSRCGSENFKAARVEEMRGKDLDYLSMIVIR